MARAIANWRNSAFHRQLWVSARKAIGGPELRDHDLRHSPAPLAVASGANVKVS